jgi:hypothetical protein
MYVSSIVVCPFVFFLLAIVLSVLLRYTVSDCSFGIFKLFLHWWICFLGWTLKIQTSLTLIKLSDIFDGSELCKFRYIKERYDLSFFFRKNILFHWIPRIVLVYNNIMLFAHKDETDQTQVLPTYGVFSFELHNNYHKYNVYIWNRACILMYIYG